VDETAKTITNDYYKQLLWIDYIRRRMIDCSDNNNNNNDNNNEEYEELIKE
jgi:hypothetical protein